MRKYFILWDIVNSQLGSGLGLRLGSGLGLDSVRVSTISTDLYNITGLLGLSKKWLKKDGVSRGYFSHCSDR